MTKSELVSVVIPTYNSANFIRECLYATLTQTYSNIEILIIDDGSNDATIDICKELISKDKRIKLFLSSKNGVSAARNIGIENATGKFIVFFDADDRPEIELIENYIKAVNEWNNRSFSFVACGMFYDNVYHRKVDDKIYILESDYGFIEGENYLLKRNYAATLAWLKIFNFVTNKFYDNELIKACNIRFDENVNIGEDLKFNLDYLDRSSGYIGMINRPLYHYIKRSEDSLSFTYHENDIEDTKAVYRRFLEWESIQEDVTQDNILVIKSIFLTDWTSRLTTMYDTYKKEGKLSLCRMLLNTEVGSYEFQNMLKEVYKAKKMSFIRFITLRTKSIDVFCFFRYLYQMSKG